MLFVQEIDLWYRKDVRYPEYANMRNALKFVPVKTDNVNLDCDVFYHYSKLKQSPDGIQTTWEYHERLGEEIFTDGSRDPMQNLINLIHNIRIFRENENYKIMFCDDYFFVRNDLYFKDRSGMSKRRGRNEGYWNNNSPFSYTDVINQTAFILTPDTYGRILYNDRIVMHHTETWYYRMHTLNFINCDRNKYREKIFYRKVPDYEYKNMQYLKYC